MLKSINERFQKIAAICGENDANELRSLALQVQELKSVVHEIGVKVGVLAPEGTSQSVPQQEEEETAAGGESFAEMSTPEREAELVDEPQDPEPPAEESSPEKTEE